MSTAEHHRVRNGGMQAAPSVHAFVVDGLGECRVVVPASWAEDARNLLEDDGDV